MFSLITIEFAAIAHLMMSVVLFLYARHRIAYLSIAWIMLIFATMYGCAMVYVVHHQIPLLGVLHPLLLIVLLACSFLQSIYPLGIIMPGYLQMKRIWLYATPAIVVITISLLTMLFGYTQVNTYNVSEFIASFYNNDVLLRIATLLLSGYYIVNIFRLPHLLLKKTILPTYLKAYGTVMGGVSIYLVLVTLYFHINLLIIYIILFTLTNIYIFCRTLESIAIALPQPTIKRVEHTPERKEKLVEEKEDFNEVNLTRFKTAEYYMQHEQPWKDNFFGRDKLCEQTGINRHLMLQCLRSQGYNNIHEYINRYRIEGVKQGMASGKVRSVAECLEMGFGSSKTARACFLKMEGVSLDDYLAEYVSGKIDMKDS